jgi:hypothetical protein
LNTPSFVPQYTSALETATSDRTYVLRSPDFTILHVAPASVLLKTPDPKAPAKMMFVSCGETAIARIALKEGPVVDQGPATAVPATRTTNNTRTARATIGDLLR